MRNCPRLLLALLACVLPAVASAQTTYLWKSSGTDWGTSGNWEVISGSGTAPPNSSNATAIFNGFGAAPGSTVNNPSLADSFQLFSLLLASNQNGGGWTFSRDSTARTVSVGGTGSFGIRTYGPATYTFTGINLTGVDSTNSNLLSLNLTSGSTTVLDGSTTAITNLGAVNLNGGTLRLDNSTTSVSTRLATTAPILLRSGTLELLGGTSTETFNVGALGGSSTAGVNTIRVTATGSAVPTLRFANDKTGTNTAFSTRFSTFNVLRFESGSGELGTDVKIAFVGTPGLGNNGLLASTTSSTSTSGTFGYAITSDSGGVDFATWDSTKGSIVRAGATSGSSGSTLSSLSTGGTTRVHYNPTADASMSSSLTVGSLRISAQSSGLALSMGTNNLVTNALMLNGTTDYTISGTGSIGASGSRYIYVNDAETTLTTSMQIVGGTNPTSFAGPGYLALNGTSLQAVGQTGTGGINTNRFDLLGGVVRGTNTNLGFNGIIISGTGANGDNYAAFNFRGGVLEIAGGSGGAGTSADFTRSLGSEDGQVRWEGGGGGFSAYKDAASVNIGGNATPSSLRWGQTNFVEDGYAMKFGSTKSEATLTFHNPLQLDQSTNQPAYSVREINVVRGTTSAQLASKTVFAGVVSGASSADLIKTGNGVLEFSANNTYSGNTLVNAGELRVTGQTGTNSGTGTGNVVVMNGGMLAGTGQALPGTGKAITVLSSGTIRGDSGTGTGTLTVGNTVIQSGGNLFANLGSVDSNGVGTSSKLALGANTLDLKTGSILKLDDVTGFSSTTAGTFKVATFTSGSSLLLDGASPTDDVFGVYTVGATTPNSGPVNLDVSGLTLANGDKLTLKRSGSDLVLVFTPVPEPASLLAVCGLAAGGFALVRRWRRKGTPVDVTPAA